MWTATRAELKHFIASEYWSKAGALAAKLEKADYQKPNPYMYGNWCVHGNSQRCKSAAGCCDRPLQTANQSGYCEMDKTSSGRLPASESLFSRLHK